MVDGQIIPLEAGPRVFPSLSFKLSATVSLSD